MHVFGEDDAPHGHMHLRFNDVPRAEGEHAARRGPRLRDLPGPPRPGPHPPLHALDRRGREGARADGPPRPQPRGVRQAARPPRQEHRDDRQGPHRDRGDAPDGAARRQGDGRDGQRRGPRVGAAPSRRWCRSACAQIIDEAIQIHGATGVSQWTPLARMYASQRTLRLADGPDEVHWHVVGRAELTRYEDDHAPTVGPTNDRSRHRLLRPVLTIRPPCRGVPRRDCRGPPAAVSRRSGSAARSAVGTSGRRGAARRPTARAGGDRCAARSRSTPPSSSAPSAAWSIVRSGRVRTCSTSPPSGEPSIA